ncbi:MAG: lipocalin-like domain-containing protein [Candidatus Promineifilaceae bacterium]
MKRILVLIIIVLLAVGYFWWQSAGETAGSTATSLIPLLAQTDTAGFARATEPNNVIFPRDLGPHNDYQTEWWYYTGNLETAEGRPFGFQLTFFRRALTPDEIGSQADGSDWRTNQVYLAHFTISDIKADTFYPTERFSRGAADLAGAQAQPYRVWLENWSAEAVNDNQVRLFAQTDQVTLDLILTQTLPPILHGDGGLSPKGPEPGNASYYYSIVQQQTAGTVTVGEESFDVTGLAWKDHEYSTSALSADAVGWDWFSLQFDDGSALMFFQIRQADGRLEPASSGTFIYPDGTTRTLDREAWQLTVTDTWVSPESGAEYPAGWQISIPELALEIEGRPFMNNQELNVSTTYWEGAVQFSGTIDGRSVEAKGYIELTGYAEAMTGRI